MRKHLEYANQTYLEHLKDSMKFCSQSLKASCYFFCHGLVPDSNQQSGSKTIEELHNTLQYKIDKMHSNNE